MFPLIVPLYCSRGGFNTQATLLAACHGSTKPPNNTATGNAAHNKRMARSGPCDYRATRGSPTEKLVDEARPRLVPTSHAEKQELTAALMSL
jgi:hypothetical protein